MKIIQIVRNFNSGGAERFVVDLSNQLCHMGHEVVILRFHDEKKLNFFEDELMDEIKMVTIKRTRKVDIALMGKIFTFLNREQPDIVHTHMNDAFLGSVISFLSLKKICFFHTLHTLPRQEAVHKLGFYFRKNLFKKKIVTPITIADEALSQLNLIYALEAMPLIYNGRSAPVKTTEFTKVKNYISSLKENAATKVVVNIGRISTEKNQLLLVETVKELNKQNGNIKLLIIGRVRSESVEAELKNAADENIIFLGEKSNVQDYLYAADVFSLSSLYEGMPISLIEAFATGCIPVCTPAGGVASMIENGVNGFLSDDFSKESLIGAFKKYLQCSPDDSMRIAQNGRQTFEQLYKIDICAENHIKLYQSRLAAKASLQAVAVQKVY